MENIIVEIEKMIKKMVMVYKNEQMVDLIKVNGSVPSFKVNNIMIMIMTNYLLPNGMHTVLPVCIDAQKFDNF